MNQAGFAAWRGVSRKTVTLWKQKGLLSMGEDGLVNVEASDALLLGHGIMLPSRAEGNSGPEPRPKVVKEDPAASVAPIDGRDFWSRAEAERVKENYAAKLRQLDYDRESGLVAEIEDVAIAVATELSLVRNKLMNIGSRVAPRVAVMRSAEEIKAMIDAEVVLALEELSLDEPGATDFDALLSSLQLRFGQPTQSGPKGAN